LHRVTPTTADAIRLTIEESFDVPRVARVKVLA
jgi:hypothetical protein